MVQIINFLSRSLCQECGAWPQTQGGYFFNAFDQVSGKGVLDHTWWRFGGGKNATNV